MGKPKYLMKIPMSTFPGGRLQQLKAIFFRGFVCRNHNSHQTHVISISMFQKDAVYLKPILNKGFMQHASCLSKLIFRKTMFHIYFYGISGFSNPIQSLEQIDQTTQIPLKQLCFYDRICTPFSEFVQRIKALFSKAYLFFSRNHDLPSSNDRDGSSQSP